MPHRDFYNQLYNQILASNAPLSPSIHAADFSSKYFFNQIQNSLNNNHFHYTPNHNNQNIFPMLNRDNNSLSANDFSNQFKNRLTDTITHSLSTQRISSTSSLESPNKESKLCNGNFKF